MEQNIVNNGFALLQLYGLAGDKPLVEESQISPINPYGSTKVAVENICNDIFNKNKKIGNS